MRPAPVLPHEVTELKARLPGWWGPFAGWSARYAMRGPRWLPMAVRKVPLHLAVFICACYARGWI